ncbi:maleate cis-trans isomerase family protein [Ruegeria arenilitoris]|uniref:maleate cis-trans isomerase family protein n=1 Tax=Ruegeria arenilitoris TaxID=1173585 RepID=UPI00147C0BD9
MADTLAPRAVIGVMTPAMNTVVQPELELLRPEGVTNQMQRFRLGGDNFSDDLPDEAAKLMDCKPAAIAIGLTTDAGPGGPDKLKARCDEIAEQLGVPVLGASGADYAALCALGAQRVGIVTPFNAEVDAVVRANTEAAGFEVVAIHGTQAPSLPEICETPLEDIRAVFARVAASDCDVILQVGTALPVVALIAELEGAHGKPIVACNAAVYWQTLRSIGITDPISGFGKLLEQH